MLEKGVKVTVIGRSGKVGKEVFGVILNDLMARVNSFSPEILLN